jgi:adenylate cyclase
VATPGSARLLKHAFSASAGLLLGLGTLLALLLITIRGDWALWDFLSRHSARPETMPAKAVLVMIDEPTVRKLSDQLGERWPWKRSTFAGLLAALHQAGAERIIVDLAFVDPSDAMEDQLLAAYAAALPQVTLAELPNRPCILNQELPPEARIPTGRVDYSPDEDGVIRGYRYADSLIRPAAEKLGWKAPEDFRVHWYGNLHALTPAHALSADRYVSEGKALVEAVHQEVLKAGGDEFDPADVRAALARLPKKPLGGELEGKTVFVGVNHAAGFDVKAFPVGKLEPGVLLHFNAWQNVAAGNWMREPWPGAAGWQMVVTGWLAGLAVLALGWRPRSGRVLRVLAPALLLASLAFVIACFFNNIVLPVTWALIAMGAATLACSLRHVFLQWKERRQMEKLFGNYVAPEVLDKLRAQPENLRLGGERRHVTLFFSDMAGFTSVSEKVEPEALVDIVNACLQAQSDPILEEGGYLDKYIGDAVMAVFGAPQEIPNHALAACRAAVACKSRLAGAARKIKEEHGVEITVRIGLNTGEAVMGNVGSDRKLNYTALGDPVNLASRLEGANKAYGTDILASEATIREAGTSIVSRPADFLKVKGKSQAIPVYEVLGLREEMGGLELARAERHARAFEHYRKREFAAGLELFELLVKEQPWDPLATLLRDRCRSFLDNPPPPDWDGVTALKDK